MMQRRLCASRAALMGVGTVLIVCASVASAATRNWNVGAGTPSSGDWDTTTANWTTGTPTYIAAGTSPNTYANGDDVTFFTETTNVNATLTIQPSGVTPNSINISGDAGFSGANYIFAGGQILGSGGMNIITSQNTGGVGPTTIMTVANPSWSGNILMGNNTSFGPNLESQASGSLGTGTITMRGQAGAGGMLRFTGPSQTATNDFVFLGGSGSSTGAGQQHIGANRTGSSGEANFKLTLTGSLTGNDDNLVITNHITFGGPSGTVEFRPGAGESITGTGSTIVRMSGLSISDPSQMLTGNLNLSFFGTYILDNMSYATFGRTPGTGANQWQISSTGGGFAARGQDVTVTSVPTDFFDINPGIGYGDASYANAAVKIQSGNTLTMSADRQLWAWGGGAAHPNQIGGFTFIGPINEIADPINSNGFTLTVAGNAVAGLIGTTPTNWQNSIAGGVVRFSNPANNIANLQIGTPGGAGAVVLTSTGAGGGGTINVGTNGTGGTGGYFYFEDVTGTGTTFTNTFNVNIPDPSGNWNNAGFGGVGGQAVFTGNAVLTAPGTLTSQGTVSGAYVPINVTAGTLTLGDSTTPATLTNNRDLNYTGPGSSGNPIPYNGMMYRKNEAGEVVLNNINYTGSNTNGYRWQLWNGTLTTTVAPTISSPAGLLSDVSLLGSDIVSQGAAPGRTWRTTTANQTYVINGGVNPLGDFRFDNITDLTLDVGGNNFFMASAGPQLVRKTGPGTLTLLSTQILTLSGDTDDMWQVEQGTLDIKGNTGNAGFRVAGGTLLSADSSGYTDGRTLEITSAGGKIGVSPNAIANVTRVASSPSIDTWTQGGDVKLASRNNLSLIFANPSFPDVTAGSLLFERDGSGTGVVQLNDTAISVSGTGRIGGSGTVRLGTTGTGTFTFNDGTLAPGSSPGILTMEANVTLTSSAAFEAELDGLAVGTQYDQLVLTNDPRARINLGGADLIVLLDFVPSTGDTFTIIDNLRTTGGTLGTFGGKPEGGLVHTSAGSLFGGLFSITYVGGTGNDVVLTYLIPEPSALALTGIASLLLLRRSKRRA